MKKLFQIPLLILLCLVNFEKAFSQNGDTLNYKTCKKASLRFYSLAKAKDYKNAYEPWLWFVDNCAKVPKYGYTYGIKILEDRYKSSSGKQKEETSKLIDSLYKNRILQFPENLGKVYSDWASSLRKIDASKEIVFKKLELAFNTDPTKMSIKNLAIYFQEFTNKNKDTNTQKVLDVYDNVLEAINKKIYYHSKALDTLKKKVTLSDKEKLELRNHQINLRGLGQVEGILDGVVFHSNLSNCEQLLPLYEKGFKIHSTDIKWLRQAFFRLSRNKCSETDIFKKISEAYLEVEPSLDGIICYVGTSNNVSIKTINSMRQAIKAEKDPYKRAEYYYKIAVMYKNRSMNISRSYAYKALKERPNFGKPYLLMANLYAKSANACGEDEFSKRMVFIAAADKAKKAKEVDPSVTSIANKYIKSYMANAPKFGGFPLDSKNLTKDFKIECWIGETVKIP